MECFILNLIHQTFQYSTGVLRREARRWQARIMEYEKLGKKTLRRRHPKIRPSRSIEKRDRAVREKSGSLCICCSIPFMEFQTPYASQPSSVPLHRRALIRDCDPRLGFAQISDSVQPMPLGNWDMKIETTHSTAVSESILGHFDKICTISSKHLTNSITKNMQITNVIHVMR